MVLHRPIENAQHSVHATCWVRPGLVGVPDITGSPSHLPVVLCRPVDRVLGLGDEFVDLGLADQ